MGSDDVDEWGIQARLDIVAWQMRDGERPEAENPGADARARRWHTILLVTAVVLIAQGVVIPFGEIIDDWLPIAAALSVFPLAAVAMIAAARHRHYRRITGVPVIGPVRDPLAAVAALMAFSRECDREETRRVVAKKERVRATFAREVVALCELAARADDRGRRRARQRNIRRIWKTCWPFLQHLNAANERLKQQEQEQVQGASTEP